MPLNVHNISDEVFPGILVGDRLAASNRFYLGKLGVTHVLNAAEGRREKNGTVDTNKEYYEPWGITYKGIQLVDVPQTNIAIYFSDVVDFIDDALETGGKVLVNCSMGMSRSASFVMAYLMLREKMSAIEALAKVRQHRYVRPNAGFLKQLDDWEVLCQRQQCNTRSHSSEACYVRN